MIAGAFEPLRSLNRRSNVNRFRIVEGRGPVARDSAGREVES